MIAAINEAKATGFELSSRAVGDLLDQGVSASVIAAMGHRSVPMPGSTPTPRFEPMPRMITATTIPELDRRKFDRVYGAGKAIAVAAMDGPPMRKSDRLRPAKICSANGWLSSTTASSETMQTPPSSIVRPRDTT
jgi:hypothetical protein